MSNKKIVLLIGDSDSGYIVYNELVKHFDISAVIVEAKPSAKSILRRRMRKLGILTVLGQIGFKLLIERFLIKKSKKRINEIYQTYSLSSNKVAPTLYVTNINDRRVLQELQSIQPDAIVVNGTRIISQEIINCTKAKMINTHAGVTPRYRGVHGAYWALAEKDEENCGVTIHLIDQGIDTGDIVGQKIIKVTEKDNFSTYPLLQLAKALPLLVQAVEDELKGELKTMSRPDLNSKLWSHPTLFQYLKYRLLRRVR